MQQINSLNGAKINLRIIASIQFVLLATVLNIATIDNKNYLLIIFSLLTIFITSLFNFRTSLNFLNNPIWLLFLYMCLSFIFNILHAQILSFIYSTFFILSFAYFQTLFKAKISVQYFKKVLLFIFCLYLLVLLISQVYVYFGFLPAYVDPEILNSHGSFGALFTSDGFTYRYYSLSNEPSYASFIIISIMFCYLSFIPVENVFNQKNILMWVGTIYMIYFFKSGFGILLLVILFIKYLSIKNIVYLSSVTIIILLLIIGLDIEVKALDRVLNLLTNLSLSNLAEIKNIDYSASFRIMPSLIYLNEFDFSSINYFLGHGAGAASTFFVPFLFKSSNILEFNGGFFPAFFFDYGLIGGLLTLLIIKFLAIEKLFSLETLIFLLLLTNANLNTQLFWFLLFLFTLKKFYLKKINSNISN